MKCAKIDWRKVDINVPTDVIAARLGCSTQTVIKHIKKLQH